jgi:hypothetical protein
MNTDLTTRMPFELATERYALTPARMLELASAVLPDACRCSSKQSSPA